MSYPINYPTPQGANVQMFTGLRVSGDNVNSGFDWVKPQGASFVWFTLIGPGGIGDGTNGGGSGAVTNFMCPAFLIPDVLSINPGQPSNLSTTIKYRQKDGTGYTLLTAGSGSAGVGGSAMTANAFTAMGFFQSIAGQNGTATTVPASTTTFLSGGGASTVTANYGYSTATAGFFQMQPIIVGAGSAQNSYGAIGCGGNSSGLYPGGPGLVVIITW